jgi:Fic family protein
MDRYLSWFEAEAIDPVLKAAIAHLWFVTIHPLDDGNGRIGRAIMDLALARADGTTQRFYSMSAQIFADRDNYYKVLEQTQRPSMDVTPWIQWFLDRMDEALAAAEGILNLVRRKQQFWAEFSTRDLNVRQLKVIDMLFDDFTGKLTNEKYTKVAKCSAPTAWRDLSELVEKNVLKVDEAGGRSTSYSLAF